jgi:chromatin assembly factor 1 subunit A
MADTPVSSSPNSLKRPHDDVELEHETNGQPHSSAEIAPSPDLSVLPLKSRPTSPDLSSLTSLPASPIAPVPPNAPPAKRQKLSPQEKAAREEQKRKDKEAKEQLRAQKAEETRKKAEQREAKKREKEVEKQQKEHAAQEKKRQKELEQDKIERVCRPNRGWFRMELAIRGLPLRLRSWSNMSQSQSRLTKFLVGVKTEPAPLNSSKPSVAVKSPTKHNFITRDEARSRSMSIDAPDSVLSTPMKQCVAKPDACTEYEKVFLPFNLPSSTTMPSNWFSSDGNSSFDGTRLDSLLSAVPKHPPTLEEHTSQYKRRRGKRIESVRDLIAKMEAYHTGSDELNIGDLSNSHIDAVSSTLTALSVLRSITVKYLHFEEDVRPPYCGTWTKCVSDQQMRSVARNSTSRIIEDLNYDYDSEAEWAEPGEGEDVDSDGEDDAESEEGEDDMDEFLDDEDDSCVRRNIGLVNSEVQCSGLQWENSSGHSVLANGSEHRADLAANRVGFIIGEKFLKAMRQSKI